MARGIDVRKAPDEKEILRTQRMYLFERKYAETGLIIGIDEVGRGPLAGPVCAGAVILPAGRELYYLNDSKKLSEKKREALFDLIREEAVCHATAYVFPERIDAVNILEATKEAMTAAVEDICSQLKARGESEAAVGTLLIDAVHVGALERFKQVSIVKGDAQSASIAAASILAKVTRDRVMTEYDEAYPGFGFAKNKGYGTAEHIAALREKGPCPIHRHSFIQGILGKR